MKVLILAGGYGTRLAAVVKDTPKPLIPVNDRPLIDYSVDKVKGIAGLTEIVVVTNNKFHGHFLKWAELCPTIRIVNDGTNTNEERLGSVGDMHFVWQKEKTPDDWLIIGGDNLFDQDLNAFMDFARAHQPAVSIGLYDIHDIKAATKFGVCAIDSQAHVTSFQEKPEQPASSLITMCVYYFPRQTLGDIEQYRKESKTLDAAGSYIKWLAEKNNVYGFNFKGKWYDIGSVESLNEARAHFAS